MIDPTAKGDRLALALTAALALAPLACSEPLDEPAPPIPTDEWDARLAERVLDYSAALRVAALRLTGELPTLAELKQVAAADDPAAQRTAYEALVRQYLASPRFARQMFRFWQDTLKLGDVPAVPRINSAPAFVARLAVEDRSFLEVFTATTGTCPGFDPLSGAFTPGDCTNTTQTVGLLTHPGMLAHFFSNFGFRRVRWVQEVFACTAFPAEIATTASDVGGASPYTGVFPFMSIAGAATGGRVDFRDTSSVICANCHSNINHIAPLFAFYNQQGQATAQMSVPAPLPGMQLAVPSDYLPAGEPLAWRFGKPVTDMRSLGAAIAADPDVPACTIARLWNWALGKPDIVDDAARVPRATIERQVAAFQAGGYRLRAALLDIFTSDDFTRF